MWDKILKALQKYGLQARDAMTGVYENGGSLLDKRYVKSDKYNSHFKSVKLDITKIKTNSKPEWVESFD